MTEIKILYQGVHENIEGKECTLITDPICSTVVLIKGEKNIIVDTGNLGFENEILENLEKEGLKVEDVDYVVTTHSHFDHISNMYLFKSAKIIGYIGIWQNKSGTFYKDADDLKIPGIERIKTPGHERGHMSVIVKSDNKTYVIAGDAIRHDMLKNGFMNEEEKESAKKILDIADIIIPGHGPVIEGDKLNEFKELVK